MNTLKLKLLAASMFACSAAFAQSVNPPPPTRTPTSAPNDLTLPAVGNREIDYSADSYVLQNGDNQYANVNQNGYRNTADIYQNYTNVAGRGGNNATQVQSNDGRDFSGARNRAYIAQEGSNSNASQLQIGVGSVARIIQGSGEGNNATQRQNGTDNSADISQIGSNGTAIQYQQGDNETASISQGNALTKNYAEQRQFGGDGNQATTTQSGVLGTFSYTEQNGTGNRAVVNQNYNTDQQQALKASR